MKLGLLTAAFNELDLESIAAWSKKNGFNALEIAMWPKEKAARRYAGVTHIDTRVLTKEIAKETKDMLNHYDIDVSALAYYPNILDPDTEVSCVAINHLKEVINAASMLEVNTVTTFIGKNKNINIEENIKLFKSVWIPIIKYAKDYNVNIAIENCPMIFSNDEWPGGNNLASSPAIWSIMFDIINEDNFGLNLDPSHLILQMIDLERAIKDFGSKIFHVHAKDLMIDRDGLYQHGVFSLGMGWQVPKIPGLGDVDWKKFFSSLYGVGYNGYVIVEHEDKNFESSLDLIKSGFLIARDTLKGYIH